MGCCEYSKNNKKKIKTKSSERDDNTINISPQNEKEKINLEKWIRLIASFGKDFLMKYKIFLNNYIILFKYSLDLKTTFYTLSFEKVQNIFDLHKNDKVLKQLISDKFYNLVINIVDKLINYAYDLKEIFEEKDELFQEVIDLQEEIIISTIRYFILLTKVDKERMSYSFIKYFQDIGFCIKYFYYLFEKFLNFDLKFFDYEFSLDFRMFYFLQYLIRLDEQSELPSNLLKLARESAMIKDTIILGDKKFRNHIRMLNIKSKRIFELDDNMIDLFFKNPYKEDNKYKITKYFVICDNISASKYIEKFKLLSSKYGFAYLFIVYIINQKKSDVRLDVNLQKSIIYILEDYELNEIYKDNNERLKPNLESLLIETKPYGESFENLKLFILNDIKNFKSSCEDGWELFEKENFVNIFNIQQQNFYTFVYNIMKNIVEAYKEHNSLEFFFKYYANYFFLTLQPEFIVNMTAYVKMILYAYTLEEGDPNKNFYCIINDDLRSTDPKKNYRYFDLIKLIGGLISTKRLKCYNGKLYRASFFKENLINSIKVGITMINPAFWSCTKKESVAKRFLKGKNKNTLIITEGGLENNIDIHLEGISKYPNEEEVLFLPFCKFKVKSYELVNENGLTYYKIILDKISDSSMIRMIEGFENMFISALNNHLE